MRVARVALGLAITMAAAAAACGGGSDAPTLGASGPGRNGSTQPPPADSADAAPDGPTSNGGLARWSAALGGPQVDVGFAVAGDSAGDTVVAGSFQGTAELGGVPMTSAGATDLFVAKYGADGKAQWVRRFGGAADDMATGVVVAPSGSIWIAGASAGALDFGTGPLGQGGAAGTFLVELDRFGNVMLAKAFGGASYGTLVGIASGGDGSIALCGAYQGTIDLGGGPLPAAQGTFDAFVAKLDPGGTLVFAQHLGGTDTDLAQGVAVGPQGEVGVIGTFAGTGTFGGSAVTSAGDSDVFASAFGPTGTALWTKTYGSPGHDDGRAVAFDPSGDVVLGGGFADAVDFGAGPASSHGATDAFVVKLDTTGALSWAQTFGGPGTDEAVSLASDSLGEPLVGGLFEQTMTVGVTPFTSAGDRDIFALKLGADGSHVWSKHFGGAEADEGVGVGYDGYGRALVTGYFRTQVDFGSGVQASAGDDDVFVATFDP
ncbi:MAG TPA: hypothetical protein VF765_08875 [Polyangiaceae bacterium]